MSNLFLLCERVTKKIQSELVYFRLLTSYKRLLTSLGFLTWSNPGTDVHAKLYPHRGTREARVGGGGGGWWNPTEFLICCSISKRFRPWWPSQQDEVYFMVGGTAGGLWCHQTSPSWPVSFYQELEIRLKRREFVSRNGLLYRFQFNLVPRALFRLWRCPALFDETLCRRLEWKIFFYG